MAHLTCVGSSRRRSAKCCAPDDGWHPNVLALRGDPPKGETSFKGCRADSRTPRNWSRSPQEWPDSASVPPAIPKATSKPRSRSDLEHLVGQGRAGADFLVSQLFFDNEDYRAFVRRCRSAGIEIPIVPGLMPITNVSQTERFTQMCGSRIPAGTAPSAEDRRQRPEPPWSPPVCSGRWTKVARCCAMGPLVCTSTRSIAVVGDAWLSTRR
jgi:methylenetetrahydrofolate reductase (NADPH)